MTIDVLPTDRIKVGTLAGVLILIGIMMMARIKLSNTFSVDVSAPPQAGQWAAQDPSFCSDDLGSFDAFIPGLRGWGSCIRGGFVPGTTVIRVSNRNATGAGSLNEAFGAACPKVILFDVGGLIERNGQFTAAVCNQWSVVGASAPSEVTLASGPTNLTGLIETNGNNWTIDHLTVASGSTPTGQADSINIGDGRGSSSGEGHAILLNNTFIWGRDEIVQCFISATDAQTEILLWQNIMGVTLDTPNTGAMTTSASCRQLNQIRNIYVHSHERIPFILSEPYFHANNIVANAKFRGPQLSPCLSSPINNPWRGNWMYNFNAKSDNSSANQRYLENPGGGVCTTMQIYETGNQVRENNGTLYDCSSHACSGNRDSFNPSVWQTSIISAAYPTGYVPEVITRNQAALEAFAIQIAAHAGSRPTNRLSYTQTRMVDEVLDIVDGSDTSSTFSSTSTLAAEGGINAITPSNTSWDPTAQCGGMPTGAAADAIQSSGLTALHEFVITCFYDNVMPAGYREAL